MLGTIIGVVSVIVIIMRLYLSNTKIRRQEQRWNVATGTPPGRRRALVDTGEGDDVSSRRFRMLSDSFSIAHLIMKPKGDCPRISER